MRHEFIKDDGWMKKLKEKNIPLNVKQKKMWGRQAYLRNRKTILEKSRKAGYHVGNS